MMATVSTSTDIAQTLCYGQNPVKGGSIILCNLTDESATPEQQAKDWEALSNNYKTKLHHIVISFSDDDTIKIRGMPPAERARFERGIIIDFMDELQRRGNNVYDCPFIIAHHGNTDNEHFHIAILNTTKDGKHFEDSYTKKNACRAAACVSMKYGLEAPPKAVRNEQNHQTAQARRKGKTLADVHNTGKKRTYNRVNKDPNELRYRAERVRLAEKRKKTCKYVIEKVANDKTTTSANYVERLKAEGLSLFHDCDEGYYVEMHDEKEGRSYSYLLEKDLGVDMALLPKLDNSKIAKGRKPKKEKPVKKVVSNVPKTAPVKQKSPIHSPGVDKLRRGINNTTIGSHGGQTQQGNVNPDGSVNNDDDLDEQWRRRNGYRM